MWERLQRRLRTEGNGFCPWGSDESQTGGGNFLLDNVKYTDRDLLLIDESHNLRNTGTQRYRLVHGLHGWLTQTGVAAC